MRLASTSPSLREEVDKLTQPPSAYGTFLRCNEDGTADVFSGGRKMRVALHPGLESNEPRSVARKWSSTSRSTSCWPAARDLSGEVVTMKEVLEDGHRAIVVGRADEERVVEMAESLMGEKLRAGDSVLMDSRSGLLLEKLPRPEVEELVLEEVPDISYEDVGGLDSQIEQITDAVELPVPLPGPVHRAQVARAQGRPALRPARLRQDPHRQGRGQLPGQEGRRALGRRCRRGATS